MNHRTDPCPRQAPPGPEVPHLSRAPGMPPRPAIPDALRT